MRERYESRCVRGRENECCWKMVPSLFPLLLKRISSLSLSPANTDEWHVCVASGYR